MSQKEKTHKREMTGVVISDKMEKTVTVLVTRTVKDALYKKNIRSSKKYKAHDEKNEAHPGDTVRIRECRPLSRDKHYRLVKVLLKSKEV